MLSLQRNSAAVQRFCVQGKNDVQADAACRSSVCKSVPWQARASNVRLRCAGYSGTLLEVSPIGYADPGMTNSERSERATEVLQI